jgi:hypothetical protein
MPVVPLSKLPSNVNLTPTAADDGASASVISSIDILRKVRLAMEKWTSDLGPVEDWPRVFREKYDEACCATTTSTTQAGVDIFLGQVGEHVRIGKSILAGVEDCYLPLCQSLKADRLLLRDITATLHRGIAILEARLEILAPAGPHVSNLQSTIRRHRDFEDLV